MSRRILALVAGLLAALVLLPAAADAYGVGVLVAQGQSPAGIGTALSAARVVRYLGIGGATGLLVLVLLVWVPLRARGTIAPDADRAFARAAGRALRVAAIVGLVGSVLALVLQGAEADGTGIGDALSPGALGDVVGTRVGAWFLITAVAFAVLAAIAGRVVAAASRGGVAPTSAPSETPAPSEASASSEPSAPSGPLTAPSALPTRPWPLALAGLLVGLLVVAPALGGHAATSSPAWALVPIQIVHVAGMGAWLGGLAGLLLVLPRAVRTLPEGRERLALQAAVLMRFSPVALVSVGVLTLAGTGLAILHLTTLYDLTDTAYGRAILVKVALLVGAIGIALVQREYLLPRLRRLADGEAPADPEAAEPRDGMLPSAPSPATGLHVRRALRAEVGLLVAVLCATGALAGYAPPRDLDQGPVTVERQAGPIRLRLTVDPARTGPNLLRLDARDAAGRPVRGVRALTARAVPPGKAGGSDVPVTVRLVAAGPGRWTAAAVPLGTRGGWTVDVVLRTAASARVEVELPVRVR